MSASETGSASKSTPLLPDEYEGLIERVRETANAMIPRNATVLVVSRGDEELLRIGPRRALHFPQDEFGRYAGYHPPDSDAAIGVLESMRARGGEYLLLPSTAFWWLEYYEGLRDHLERNYPPIVSADDCIVYELAATGVQTAAGDADTRTVSAATSSRQARRAAGRAAPGAPTRRCPHRHGHPGHITNCSASGTAAPCLRPTEATACVPCSKRPMPKEPSSW